MAVALQIQKLTDDFLAEVPDHAGFCKRIVLPDGREAGQTLSLKGHPAQEAILRALDSGKYRKFAWAKPVQDGGTLVMFLPLLRRAVVERQKVVLAYPSVDAAKDIWSTKLWPILASYGGQSPETGGGSKGGAARLVKLPGGGMFMLRAAGGRGESGQASITGDVLGVDEVDDWPDLHRLELISRRITESPDPLAVFCCTVKRDGVKGSENYSLILQLVEEGTNGHLEYPCPACEEFQRMEWERIDLAEKAYRCKCGPSMSAVMRSRSGARFNNSINQIFGLCAGRRWTHLANQYRNFAGNTNAPRSMLRPGIMGRCDLFTGTG